MARTPRYKAVQVIVRTTSVCSTYLRDESAEYAGQEAVARACNVRGVRLAMMLLDLQGKVHTGTGSRRNNTHKSGSVLGLVVVPLHAGKTLNSLQLLHPQHTWRPALLRITATAVFCSVSQAARSKAPHAGVWLPSSCAPRTGQKAALHVCR